jgi:hypothetical protein
MATAPDIGLRELDHRSNDGIDARLLWDRHADRVTVAVRDERSDESLESVMIELAYCIGSLGRGDVRARG